MLLNKDEEIINFIKVVGPSLPVDISKKLGINSILTTALLAELVKSGKIKESARKFGNSSYYYVDGQEEILRNKLLQDLKYQEKLVLERIKKEKFVFEEDLSPQERFFIKNLLDFVTPLRIKIGENEGLCWKYYSTKLEEIEETIRKMLEEKKVEKEKEGVQKEIPKEAPKEFKKEEKISDFEKCVEEILKNFAEINEKKVVKKNNEINYVVSSNTNFGKVSFYVKAKRKAKISESDLSLLFTEGNRRKMPMILITDGEIPKKVESFRQKNFGDLLKIVKI
ncbi:MAG: hypothetical protein OH319_00900 [Candidatus Parvarchaeota archaeon]|nr:hypothetical protein [Candidatus Jingweiarchaeum tengchongense]MCW1297865.1 hypothetical protein [Candidatus Jingweiarchaeum tengchongense]MCW1299876.1 hypothetical protein [Candidatus Jingweiarchaeum tengchongense]MCW1304154.1 hypothetical protein [Candidatus Jingweiarchaeum tengchongense]MCW1305182.1 hypothetical protein [Candidatus Jingweiarchaeum tengchongense]